MIRHHSGLALIRGSIQELADPRYGEIKDTDRLHEHEEHMRILQPQLGLEFGDEFFEACFQIPHVSNRQNRQMFRQLPGELHRFKVRRQQKINCVFGIGIANCIVKHHR